MSHIIYNRFTNYVNYITTNNNLTNFKNHDDVTYMLEHVSYQQGNEYLNLIKNSTSISMSDIIKYCYDNDKIGEGKKYNYGFVTTSPSNFRYIFHSHLILLHLLTLELNEVNIVEVGCGYGGLCLAISQFSKLYNIKVVNYNLVDLPQISLLQQQYLSNHTVDMKLNFYNSHNYGRDVTDNNLFLISNYCFSEIDKVHQERYITNLFPKVSHGFIAWNMIDVYNFGFKYREEIEYPLTGPKNKYIYF
jgi:hypothetical protein